jgi:hypothetical protein
MPRTKNRSDGTRQYSRDLVMFGTAKSHHLTESTPLPRYALTFRLVARTVKIEKKYSELGVLLVLASIRGMRLRSLIDIYCDSVAT